MKKLKLNLIAIAALAIAAVTMSFEMNSNTMADGWYAVGTDGESIVGATSAPMPGEQCQTTKLHDLCKIKVPASEVPESVSQAREDGLIEEEAFRNL